MQNINEIIVLVIVFIAVLVCVAVFLPVFFAQKTEAAEDLQHIVDDPVRRFIEPENLQKMRYSSCMIVAVAALALIIVPPYVSRSSIT